MSYTSKFTGAEIDSLLSSISSINATKTILFEGQLGGTDAYATLSDSIFNYDFISVEAQIIDNTGSQGAAASVLISVDEIEDFNDRGFSIFTSADPSKHWYRVSFSFTNDNVIHLAKSNVSSSLWTNPHIYKVIGIKFAQSLLAGGSASNPIGSILPVMGTEAPQDYLICDGRELQISEYKELADYFEKQFGDNGYFGGDGIKTFKLPDLRNEFLRGYGDLSGEIGIHQDATTHLNLFVGGDNVLILDTQPSAGMAINQDGDTGVDMTGNSRNYYYIDKTNQDDNSYGGIPTFYKSRPTNVAVLYCIKYTESASGNGGSSASENYSTEETRIGTWIDGKPLYRKVYVFDVTATPSQQAIIFDDNFVDKELKNTNGYASSDIPDYMNGWTGRYPIPLYNYMSNSCFMFHVFEELDTLRLNVQWSVTQKFTIYAIVEYTKTTD